MRLTPAFVLGTVIFVAPTAAVAQEPCDSYSQGCPPTGSTTSPSPSTQIDHGGVTLPMTGAELTTMLLVGTVAIGTGTTLVLAGRQRRRTVD